MTKIILKVHIPQGEPLDEGKCRKFFPDRQNALCGSWLLNPGLE
ncbi:hypothetical protein WKU36_00065 [Blautia sp. ICN-22010]